jgi:hypothetical protein
MFFRVDLFMFLQVLRSLEGLFTIATTMRFQRHMDPKMASDVVPFDDGDVAVHPMTSQTQIPHRLAAHMIVRQVAVQLFGIKVLSATALPETGKDFVIHGNW